MTENSLVTHVLPLRGWMFLSPPPRLLLAAAAAAAGNL